MGARRKGRELAVQALYQIELRGTVSLVDSLRMFWEHCEGGSRAKEFAAALVTGVGEQQQQIDELITASIEHWRFERLSSVDLNILRVATYELLQTPPTPTSVVLDEAIEIARRFGTSESSVFVNGVLDQIAQRLGRKEAPKHQGPDPGAPEGGAPDDG
jgi:N utilization substance protein B